MIKILKKAEKIKIIKVLTVDDHPLILEGLSTRLRREPDITVCGEADTPEKTIECVKNLSPDVVILDLSLGGANDMDLLKAIKVKAPNVRILVLSMREESIYAERLIRSGAQGYVMKNEATQNLVKAIREVMQGEIYVSKAQAHRMLNKFAGTNSENISSFPDCLSERELEAFKLYGKGCTTKEAADSMGISAKTIETYRARIKSKLGLKSSNELTRCAMDWVANANE